LWCDWPREIIVEAGEVTSDAESTDVSAGTYTENEGEQQRDVNQLLPSNTILNGREWKGKRRNY
jgi:hypothetical protein